MISTSREHRHNTRSRRGIILLDALRESLLIVVIVAGTVVLLRGSWSQVEPVQARAASASLPIYSVSPASTGTQLWAIQHGAGARLLDAANGQQLAGWNFPKGEVSCVSLATGGGDLVVMSADKSHVEFLRHGRPFALEALPESVGLVSSVAVSPTGKQAAVATNRGHLLLYTFEGDAVTLRRAEYAAAIGNLAWSPRNQHVAMSIGVEDVVIIDISTLEITAQWLAHQHNCSAIAWSADGQRLATCGRDAYVRLWNVETWTMVWEQVADCIDPSTVCFDGSGTHLVTGGFDRHIVVWDVATGNELERLDGHSGTIRALAFSVDGQMLYTAGLDGQLFAWDWATRSITRKFQ